MTDRERLIQQARNFGFVREVGSPNHGLWVGIFQRFVGIADGQSWCAAFVCFVLAIIVDGRDLLPFPATGVCEEIHQWAVTHNKIVSLEQGLPGDLYLYVTPEGHAHHVGILTAPWHDGPDGIAGNTSRDGKSSNGDGVYEHTLTAGIVIVRVLNG